jgi:hypothetical protein
MGYDRAQNKAMRPAWLRFMELPIQVLIIVIGLAWFGLGMAWLR